MEEKIISLDELTKFFWKACDILHGEVDVSQYKDLIFGFIALKYLSDLSGHQSIITQNSIKLSDESRWSKLESESADINGVILKAAQKIEEHNPVFEGVFSAIGFCSRLKLSDNTLKQLVNHFSHINLYTTNTESQCILGYACSDLLEKIAQNSGKFNGDCNTPTVLSKLLVRLVAPAEGMSVYDPVAGTGGMLAEVLSYRNCHNDSVENIRLYGQEINQNSWAICKINLFLHGAFNTNIALGSVLTEPRFIEKQQISQFDRVIADPPFNMRWDAKIVENDIYHRFSFGVPPNNSADFAFIQHMVASLNDKGVMAAFVAPGCMFRGGKEKEIRTKLVEADLIEAVINLPASMFYNTGIPANILIINKDKLEDRKNKILFIDASADFVKATRHINVLNHDQLQSIIDTYKAFDENGSYSKVADFEEVKTNEFNLNVRRYADNSPEAKQLRALKTQFSDYKMEYLSAPEICIDVKSLGVATDIGCVENALFLPKIPTMSIHVDLPKEGVKQENYFQISLNPRKIINEYARQFFESEVGRLILSSLSEGATIPRLTVDSLNSGCLIVVPSVATQKHVIQASRKLKHLESSLHDFTKEISLNPNGADSILDTIDGMLESLSELSEADQIMALIRKGESKHLEFKQTLSLDVRRALNDKKYSAIKEQEIEKSSLKTIVGFINSDGGVLLIGVNDNGEILGLEEEIKKFHKDSEDNYLKHLKNLTAEKIGRDFYPYFDSNIIKLQGKRVMVVKCKQSEKDPCYLEEEFYVRTNPATDKLTAKQANEYITKHFKR